MQALVLKTSCPYSERYAYRCGRCFKERPLPFWHIPCGDPDALHPALDFCLDCVPTPFVGVHKFIPGRTLVMVNITNPYRARDATTLYDCNTCGAHCPSPVWHCERIRPLGDDFDLCTGCKPTPLQVRGPGDFVFTLYEGVNPLQPYTGEATPFECSRCHIASPDPVWLSMPDPCHLPSARVLCTACLPLPPTAKDRRYFRHQFDLLRGISPRHFAGVQEWACVQCRKANPMPVWNSRRFDAHRGWLDLCTRCLPGPEAEEEVKEDDVVVGDKDPDHT